MKKNKNSPKILFFDIETSYCQGWFWRPGYKLSIDYNQVLKESAIICLCYKYNNSSKIEYLTWKKGDDKDLCLKFASILKDVDVVCGHNSDKFDIPWFRTRLLFHGAKNIPIIQSIDTLKISRSKFKFNSNRLDYLGKFFGFGGKKDTGGIELWHKIIQNNDVSAMTKMVKYCKRDVLLLEKIYNKLEVFTAPKVHAGVLKGNNRCSCPGCGSNRTISDGNLITSLGIRKKKMNCKSCNRYFTINESVYLKDRKL